MITYFFGDFADVDTDNSFRAIFEMTLLGPIIPVFTIGAAFGGIWIYIVVLAEFLVLWSFFTGLTYIFLSIRHKKWLKRGNNGDA